MTCYEKLRSKNDPSKYYRLRRYIEAMENNALDKYYQEKEKKQKNMQRKGLK